MPNVTLYAPDGSSVSVADTPASYVARLMARGYSASPPAQVTGFTTKTVLASATQTVTGVTAGIRVSARAMAARSMILHNNITAAPGGTGTLILSLEWSPDGGTNWSLPDPAESFTSRSSPGGWVKVFTPKADTYRIRWTIGGTTPSFTFDVKESAPL